MNKVKISAVIPVYNSCSILQGTYTSVKKVLSEMTDEYEILFRNDGSRDGSQKVLEKIARSDKHVRIFFNENHGLGYVLRQMFKDARGELVVYMDADAYMTFGLSQLPSLAGRTNEADVVIASRYNHGSIPLHRLIPSRTYKLINELLFGVGIDDIGSGLVVFKKSALDRIKLYSDGFEIHIELYTKLHKAGFRIIEVPTDYVHWDEGSFNMLKHGPRTLAMTMKYWLTRYM
ncbi:MAG: glycosyltransferase family 2 protein [Candidatus Aenigmarchaeota archaeon]|nr:glycosyltransferase family 2 protein [Candidatus Aenigmarchaeota archaeon]